MQRLIGGSLVTLFLLIGYGLWLLAYRLITGSWTEPEQLLPEVESECED